jgi:hypothetical protein
MSTQFAALTINVDASQVQVGDQIVWGGVPYPIAFIKPYLASDIWLRRDWRIAVARDGRGWTLVPGERFEVIRL